MISVASASSLSRWAAWCSWTAMAAGDFFLAFRAGVLRALPSRPTRAATVSRHSSAGATDSLVTDADLRRYGSVGLLGISQGTAIAGGICTDATSRTADFGGGWVRVLKRYDHIGGGHAQISRGLK
jgi:hypothetical protein